MIKTSHQDQVHTLLKMIERWRNIVFKLKHEFETGPFDSGCCHVYLYNRCSGCPIKETTGNFGCRGTPYEAWNNNFKKNGRLEERKVTDEKSFKLASDMLSYLQTLLDHLISVDREVNYIEDNYVTS